MINVQPVKQQQKSRTRTENIVTVETDKGIYRFSVDPERKIYRLESMPGNNHDHPEWPYKEGKLFWEINRMVTKLEY